MKIFLPCLIITAFASCQPVNLHQRNTDSQDKLQQLSWMLGRWQMQTPQGLITEEWSRPSDTQWHGKSYMVSAKGDTTFQEHIRLDYSDDRLTYAPTVADQNQGSEVRFTEKSFSDSLVVFENLSHDFPQRIIYKRLSDSTILAAVEGRENGQQKREEFAYIKAK